MNFLGKLFGCKHNQKMIIFDVSQQILADCKMCGQRLSWMFDKDKQKRVWIEGNFIVDLHQPLYILTETKEEFEKVRTLLVEEAYMDRKKIINIDPPEKLMNQKNPQILLYGSWWEREEVVQTDWFTTFLNQKI